MSSERTVKFVVKPTGSSNFSLRYRTGEGEAPIFKFFFLRGIGEKDEVVNMTAITLWLWHVITLPFRRTIPAVVFATVVWTISYNVGVRYWKGPDHPVNRFQWRRMEKAGLLPDELLQKKKVVLEYHKSRLYSPRSGPVPTEDFF